VIELLGAAGGIISMGISLFRDGNTLHDSYKKVGGFVHSTDHEKVMNELGRIKRQQAQGYENIADMVIERLSPHIFYAPDVQAIKDNNLSRQQQDSALRQTRESLDPLQKALGGDLLSSAVIWTPEKMQQAFDQDPWQVLIDVRPVARAAKPNNADMIPFLFDEAGTQYIGWQIKGVLPMMFDCHYNEIWTPSAANSGRSRRNGERNHQQGMSGQTGQDQYGKYTDLVIKKITQRLRFIPAGNFLMGSPESEPQRQSGETQHAVSIENAVWMADTACTQALWKKVMGDNPSHFTKYFGNSSTNPVESVSWDEVQVFLQRANTHIPNRVIRLPSEAEWEYACRAGTHTPFSFGNTITPKQVNYDGNSSYHNGNKGVYREKTVVVKSFTPNPWGLYQMHGNVWEWCQDRYHDYANTPTDGSAATDGDSACRVLRGGSWNLFPSRLRSARRDFNSSDDRYNNFGFRFVCSHPLTEH